MPKPAKTPKPVKPAKPHYNWRISEAAHKILAKDWTLDSEPQSAVLDRVLAFAAVAKKLASIMELPVGQITPDALLAAATTRFEALSNNLKATADQMAQLKAQHDAAQRTITLLTSERDALSARLAALQAELKDAATRHAPPVIGSYQAAHDISKPLDSLTPAEQGSVLTHICKQIKAAANPR
jgi:septal ring factor EnvC (AmiA/AmiB activator)